MIIPNMNVKNIDKNEPVSKYDAFVAIDAEGNIMALYLYMSKAYLNSQEITRYFYTVFLADGKVESFYIDGNNNFFYEVGNHNVVFREVNRDIHADITFDYVCES